MRICNFENLLNRELGMMESLFAKLDTKEVTANLTLQYRMNEPIMSLANSLIYDGQLQCANSQIAEATLVIPEYKVSIFSELLFLSI